MKYFVVLLFVLCSITSTADTTCHWKKVRGSNWVQYNSNQVNPKSIQECFYTMKKPIVLTEPFEDGNEFEGEVFIADFHTSTIIDSCNTLTINGLNPNDESDKNRLGRFMEDVMASGDNSGDTTTNSPKWQNYFDSKIKMDCK